MTDQISKGTNEEPRIGILILNWNLWEMTLKCLESIDVSRYDNLEILVIDNGSTNESVDEISRWIERRRAEKPESHMRNFRITSTGGNLGYSGGNNLGMRDLLREKVDFILLLNNDVVVSPEAIRTLVSHSTMHQEYAFLGPKILIMERPKVIQCKGASLTRRFLSLKPNGYGTQDEDDSPGILNVDALYGACLLVRTSSLRRIGGLDESFKFYSEDIEWSIRASRAGYKVGCVPSAVVWHKGEASTIYLGHYRRYQGGRGRAVVLRRYAPRTIQVLYLLMRLPLEASQLIHADRDMKSGLSFIKGILSIYLKSRTPLRDGGIADVEVGSLMEDMHPQLSSQREDS